MAMKVTARPLLQIDASKNCFDVSLERTNNKI